MSNIVSEIQQLIEKRHLLNHPFYQMWSDGTLKLDTIRDYAKQYYHHVYAFPTYVSAVHSNCPDIRLRQTLLENLIEEERGDHNHPELWMNFCSGLDLRRQEVVEAEPYPETAGLISTYKDLTRNHSFLEGLASLYAYEYQIPSISEAKIEGLKKHYGRSDESTISFFEAHIKYDKIHAKSEEEILAEYIREDDAPVKESARRALDALWAMLDGILKHNSPSPRS